MLKTCRPAICDGLPARLEVPVGRLAIRDPVLAKGEVINCSAVGIAAVIIAAWADNLSILDRMH